MEDKTIEDKTIKEIKEIIIGKFWDNLEEIELVYGDSPDSFVSPLLDEIIEETIKEVEKKQGDK
ncbi:MAG TPA: hypothetical protein ENH46_01900 [Candidatus Pacearchaeota archaeon]|nr:hypothetical protein [Candidatus Pacearchaeota archaeon]